jgi:hypothetical protein
LVGTHALAAVEIKLPILLSIVKLGGLVAVDLLILGWGCTYIAVNVALRFFLFKFDWPDE